MRVDALVAVVAKVTAPLSGPLWEFAAVFYSNYFELLAQRLAINEQASV